MTPLTPEQVERFRVRLEALREEVNERLRMSRESSRPVDLGEPIGRLSRVDAMQAQQLSKSQRTRDEVLVQLINSALGRLRTGTYGECLKCEEEIPLARLEASPEAALCLACRREGELS